MKITSIFLLVFTLIFSAVNTEAQVVSRPKQGAAGTWRLLGQVTAAAGADHDIIAVAGPFDYFRKLKFKVTNSPIVIYKMVVTYQDGLPEKIETRCEIKKGGESRVIDLKGGKRKLKTVEFWYESKGVLNGKADLTLFGMK